MNFYRISFFTLSALAVCGTLNAQDLRGVVRDADKQPLIGASVYWAGTTIGAGADRRSGPVDRGSDQRLFVRIADHAPQILGVQRTANGEGRKRKE